MLTDKSDTQYSQQAFPSTGEGFGNPLYSAPGMTLLEWYAGQADVPWNSVMDALARNGGPTDPTIGEVVAYRAKIKFAEADAMMAEREARRNKDV